MLNSEFNFCQTFWSYFIGSLLQHCKYFTSTVWV